MEIFRASIVSTENDNIQNTMLIQVDQTNGFGCLIFRVRFNNLADDKNTFYGK